MLPCSRCGGRGTVLTKPGGAGMPLLVGTARCRECAGMGVAPCPLCSCAEVTPARPPDGVRGPVPLEPRDVAQSDVDWLDDSFP